MKNEKSEYLIKQGLKVSKKDIVFEDNYWKILAAHDGYYKKFNLIFILCESLNPEEIQLTEHLDYFWIRKTEFSKFQFLEGDISFIQNYLLNK